jgi:light-regulated signal transduction histidine kinase (bacteriophytochrome)
LSNAISSKLTAEEQENLDFVIEGSQKMNEVINSLLKYYQLENRQFKPRPVSLTEIIDDLLQNELDNINQTVDINVQVPPELPAISADENSLRETMYHLISNAFKYRQKDIPLHISITAELMDDEHIKILVQDNGIGLKEMYHKDIFKMFKKVTAEDNASGPGIGLALCKKIVSKHGGDIGVTSSSGEGAAFWFTMPVAHEPAAALNAMGIS